MSFRINFGTPSTPIVNTPAANEGSTESKEMEAALKAIREGIVSETNVQPSEQESKKRKLEYETITVETPVPRRKPVPQTPMKKIPQTPMKKNSAVSRVNRDLTKNLFGNFEKATPIAFIIPENNVSSEEPISFRNLYQNAAEQGVIKKNKGSLKNDINVQYYGTGGYMEVCVITTQEPLYPSIPNSQLIIKYYKDKISRFKESVLKEYLDSSLKNYADAKKCGLSVATIYNYESVQEDLFFVQEKIPYAVNIDNPSDREQVRQFFITVLKEKIDFDIKPDNLLVREDGTVTLIDFIETKEDGFFFKQALSLWAKEFAAKHHNNEEETKKFLAEFTKGFDAFGYDMTQNDTILKDLDLSFKPAILVWNNKV